MNAQPQPKHVPEPIFKVPYLFVTSFSPAGYECYGKRFLETFVAHWPKDAILAVFHENAKPDIDDPRIWYFDLKEDRDLQDWMMRYGADDRARGIIVTADGEKRRDFRYDAVRFAPKVFALTSPILPTTQWRIWIDADVAATKDIPAEFFGNLLDTNAIGVYLGRPRQVFHTSECGFVAYRTEHEAGRQFLRDFRLNYAHGKIFGFPEWHDSAVFDVLRKAYEQASCEFLDLAAPYYKQVGQLASFEEHGHPWPHTPLGEYLEHNKGPAGKEKAIEVQPEKPISVDLQRLCNDPALKNRYQQVERILSILPHERIVEVGVATGEWAIRMCKINLCRGKSVHYIGFDLFEDITPEVAEEEMNHKVVLRKDAVEARFNEIAVEFPGLFTFELVKGNTRETLPKYKFPKDGIEFAFLDGGHSIETIASDFSVLSKVSRLIVLDDYYEKGADTTKYGCNKLIDAMPPGKRTILPVTDNFDTGVSVRMAVVGDILRRHGEPMPIKIKTKNCVEDEEIHANIRNAARYSEAGLLNLVKELQETHKDDPAGLLKALKGLDPGYQATWLPGVLKPNNDTVVFVGGSDPVINEKDSEYAANWAKIKELQDSGAKIVVSKTSYPAAFREGLLPWACILLDPRDHVASTLIPQDCRVIFFIASMCHPSTWSHVTLFRPKVFGYHARVGAGEGVPILKFFGDSPIVHGGTTSSFRGISLLYNLGFRHIKTIGLDSSYREKPVKLHGRSEKPVQNVTIGTDVGIPRKFWTDPELIAQSQDAEMIRKLHPNLDIEYLGDGLLQHAQKVMGEMFKRADPLAVAPREQLIATWYKTIEGRHTLSESLFIDDLVTTLQGRQIALKELREKQPSFSELINS